MSNAIDKSVIVLNSTSVEKAVASSSAEKPAAAKKTVGNAESKTADEAKAVVPADEAKAVVPADEAKAVPANDGYIRLRVITSDDNNEVHFRVKLNTAMGRLKRSYSRKMGQQVEELRFMFEGYRITDEDTAASLHMENDDVIEIYQQRMGGSM